MATANAKVQKLEGSKVPAWMSVVTEGMERYKANKGFNLSRWLTTKEIPANDAEVVNTFLTPLVIKAKEEKTTAALYTLRRAVILGSKGYKACLDAGDKVFDADPATKKSKVGYSGNAKTIADRIADARCEGLDMPKAIAKAKNAKAPVGALKVTKAEGAAHYRALVALKARLELDTKQGVAYTSVLDALAKFF